MKQGIDFVDPPRARTHARRRTHAHGTHLEPHEQGVEELRVAAREQLPQGARINEV